MTDPNNRKIDNPGASNIVPLFPGTIDAECAPGVPRHDIAEMLRQIADRAERGEIDALAMSFSIVGGGISFGLSSTENHPWAMLGSLEGLRDKMKERIAIDEALRS